LSTKSGFSAKHHDLIKGGKNEKIAWTLIFLMTLPAVSLWAGGANIFV